MIVCQFAICAKRVIVDQTSNELSVIDVVEGIKSARFPVVLPGLECVFMMRRSLDEESIQNFRFVTTIDDEQLNEHAIRSDFKLGDVNRAVVRFEGFLISRPGNIKFTLLLNEQVLGSCQFPAIALESGSPTSA